MKKNSWKKCDLKELSTLITRGITPKYSTQGIFVLNQKCIRNGKVSYRESRLHDNLTKKVNSEKYLQQGDTLVCSTGVGTLGRVGRFIECIPGDSTVDSHVTIVRPSSKIFPLFLSYALWYKQPEIEALAEGTTGQTELSRIKLGTLQIDLPPLDEQKRIAGVLGAFDDKIELLQKQNKTLEDMAKAIFKSWFVDFDVVRAKQKGLPKADIMREYHLTDDLYDLFPSSFADSPLGPIPSGWTSTELKYYCQICSGFAFKSSNFNKNGKYKLVTIRNVQDGFFVQAVKDNITDIPSKMPDYCYLQDGDILLSLTGNVGRICLVYGKNYLLNQRVAKLLPRNSGDYMFLYSLFRTPSVYKKMQELAVGSAQQNLSPILTGNILFPLINRRILDIFSEITLPMYRKILINNKQIQTLTELRDTLLPPLISGKIRV